MTSGRLPARWLAFAVNVAAVAASVTTYLLACGPWLTQFETIAAIEPARTDRYLAGDLGVVRPRFARRYLVQAYRVINGRSPLVDRPAERSRRANAASADAVTADDWFALKDRVLGSSLAPEQRGRAGFSPVRDVGNYQHVLNCTYGALTHAARTLKARIERFGAGAAEVKDWTRAQVAVFRNCSDPPLALPEPAPAALDPILRADRAYQTAAAYFYATEYQEAARRFLAIGNDSSSPWQPYGRFLAGRTHIRHATVKDEPQPERERLLTLAEGDLKATLADPRAAELHASARGLLRFIALRLRPIDRLHELSRLLAGSAAPREEDLFDYRWLMDRFVGDTVDYTHEAIRDRAALEVGDDLTDWVLAVQGTGDSALTRALDRWEATKSTTWLVAALWQLRAPHAQANDVLAAARAVDRRSPAYPTVAFLHVRLLITLGRQEEARAVLATLPFEPQGSFDVESINLVKAERLLLARTFDEFLANAPRTMVVEHTAFEPPQPFQRRMPPLDNQSFDSDAAIVFSERLPLDRLVAAASADTLPLRLRTRVALAAFARAVVLRRDEAGVRVAAALRDLSPSIRADLDRYRDAPTPAARHSVGILLLLRNPGIHTYVRGLEDDQSHQRSEPAREFDHLLRRVWWCAPENDDPGWSHWLPRSELTRLLDLREVPSDLPFLTADDRAVAGQERAALRAVGGGASYLAAEALGWARTDPSNPDVPEALAQVVEGWRWRCGDADKWELARRAFQTLHRQYPQSGWAKKTQYWYR